MIDFHCNKRHKDMTPIVKDTEIQDYAEVLLQDYKKQLLREPGKINPLHFVESYLGAVVDYQDIYYPENTPAIAGAPYSTMTEFWYLTGKKNALNRLRWQQILC